MSTLVGYDCILIAFEGDVCHDSDTIITFDEQLTDRLQLFAHFRQVFVHIDLNFPKPNLSFSRFTQQIYDFLVRSICPKGIITLLSARCCGLKLKLNTTALPVVCVTRSRD